MTAEPEVGGRYFHSVLFPRPDNGRRDSSEEPDYFVDLNLDQVLEALTAGREEYELSSFFCTPLHDVAVVGYRHEVLRDLEQPAVFAAVDRFALSMRRMREHLSQAEKLHYELQRQSWFVDAVEIYCDAVCVLVDDLNQTELCSSGLCGLRDHLTDYLASGQFVSLMRETSGIKEAIRAIRYSVLIHGGRVTVTGYGGAADYSERVQRTFERFRQGAARSYRATLPDYIEMNHVEARILDGVAELHPDVFAKRADYCMRHRDFIDPTIAGFDREIQFFVAYLELVERVRAAGLSFCYPRVSAQSRDVSAAETFDLALANKLIAEGRSVVYNDFRLEEPERMLVVSGPNNGGKTTFARMFGQLHHLAALGLLVPGREAQVFLSDHIYTHFEREEDIETLRGKFEDELVRVHDILARAGPKSVIVMNESFNSAALDDARFVGGEVMSRILELGCLGVYVTFVEELASFSDATVSMVTQIVSDDPTERTFRVLRQPADGLAYAWAIADKYGLTYERVAARIGA